jgi:hypothetical protein
VMDCVPEYNEDVPPDVTVASVPAFPLTPIVQPNVFPG